LLRVLHDLPSQCCSQNPLRSAVTEYPNESVFMSGVFEEFAALFNKNLFLFGTTALVSQLSKTSITSQQMNVSRIVDFAIRSPECFARRLRSNFDSFRFGSHLKSLKLVGRCIVKNRPASEVEAG
jgi:hypothetical protein